MKEIILHASNDRQRYINISSGFAEGTDNFHLDGTLLLDFKVMSKSFLDDFHNSRLDYEDLHRMESKQKSKITFIDTSGVRVFVLEINPIFSTLTLKSDYRKVLYNLNYFNYLR